MKLEWWPAEALISKKPAGQGPRLEQVPWRYPMGLPTIA
jgi:hypothetical protein